MRGFLSRLLFQEEPTLVSTPSLKLNRHEHRRTNTPSNPNNKFPKTSTQKKVSKTSNGRVTGSASLKVVDGKRDGFLWLRLLVGVRVQAGVAVLGASGQGTAQETGGGHGVAMRVGGGRLVAVILEDAQLAKNGHSWHEEDGGQHQQCARHARVPRVRLAFHHTLQRVST